MGITISFGIQKGGVGKTTTTAICAYLLARKSKVLAVDFDSQGNLTAFLTQRNIYDFEGHTVLQAMMERNPTPYIQTVADNLDVLPAEDLLATFARYTYTQQKGDPNVILCDTLRVVKDDYDYILIDLPPNLGEQTINGLTASDYAVVMLQTEPFCFDALDRYIELLQHIQERTNPNLRLSGILATMMDSRTTLDSAIIEQAIKDYEDVVFKSVIRRRARIKEFSIQGLQSKTRADNSALRPYQDFVKELKERVKESATR
ncbi:ParA family protein [Alicyclobacillus ferrooxydans]|uniref:Chromosome partitioning protein n=1 Tax=Alicyclobacillus ferrooxydans TaxID=471514 RepID=A0A0P9CW07_9BACL|nr:ParA family protein [Alicyclobacillus ferrooxydans]KPV43964.1 chromosome partitioning protein [Alicyclobacillus ferrooxydans]